MTTAVAQPQQQSVMTAKSLFSREDIKSKFEELLGKRASAFMTSVLQIVASNDLLKDADPMSIYQAAATAATLDLPLNNNLGFAYIVPYNVKQKDGSFKKAAQFQMGYKGFIQLAQRSGQFQTLSSTAIYDGQIVEENPLTGFVFDFTKKKSDNVVGYAAYFKLINGFEKTLYMTVAELQKHGQKFSKTYDKPGSLYKTDFPSMASKTVLKLLLSKFAPLSVEMQRAVITDQAIINDSETMDVDYVDHDETPVNKELERMRIMIEEAQSLDELAKLEPNVPEELKPMFDATKEALTL